MDKLLDEEASLKLISEITDKECEGWLDNEVEFTLVNINSGVLYKSHNWMKNIPKSDLEKIIQYEINESKEIFEI